MGEALIIDDDPTRAEGILQMLTLLQVPARVACTWSAAMSLLRGFTPTVILLDSGTLGAEDIAELGTLRHEQRLAAVPVLITAADDDPETREQAVKLAARATVLRPFGLDVLESNLRHLGLPAQRAIQGAAASPPAVPASDSPRATTHSEAEAPIPIRRGDMAPDFELQDDTGIWRRLSDLRGRPVVLFFYPADDTPGCTKEACSFRDGYSAYEQDGVTVLGISPDAVRSHAKFKQKHNLPFPLLADPGHRVCSMYGVWGLRKFLGRSFEGVLRTTFIVDKTGRIVRVFEKVRPAEHSAEVLAALDSLQSGPSG